MNPLLVSDSQSLSLPLGLKSVALLELPLLLSYSRYRETKARSRTQDMGSEVGYERVCLALTMCSSSKEKGVLISAFFPVIFLKVWEWLEPRKYANLHLLGRQVKRY